MRAARSWSSTIQNRPILRRSGSKSITSGRGWRGGGCDRDSKPERRQRQVEIREALIWTVIGSYRGADPSPSYYLVAWFALSMKSALSDHDLVKCEVRCQKCVTIFVQDPPKQAGKLRCQPLDIR